MLPALFLYATMVDSVRADSASWIQADLAAARPALAASPLTPVAVRAHLGYVDAAVVHWLALPAEQRAQLTPAMLADLAAGAFTGTVGVLADDLDQQNPGVVDGPQESCQRSREHEVQPVTVPDGERDAAGQEQQGR